MLPVVMGNLPMPRFLRPTGGAHRRIVAPESSCLRHRRFINPEDQIKALHQLEALIRGERLEPGTGVLHGARRLARGDFGKNALGFARVGERVNRLVGEESEHEELCQQVIILVIAYPVTPALSCLSEPRCRKDRPPAKPLRAARRGRQKHHEAGRNQWPDQLRYKGASWMIPVKWTLIISPASTAHAPLP